MTRLTNTLRYFVSKFYKCNLRLKLKIFSAQRIAEDASSINFCANTRFVEKNVTGCEFNIKANFFYPEYEE